MKVKNQTRLEYMTVTKAFSAVITANKGKTIRKRDRNKEVEPLGET